MWHHFHLQQVCWFPFNLAILDHLEQERFLKAAEFFFPQRPKNVMIEQVFELTRTRSSGGGHARVFDAGNLAQPLELHIPASRM